CVSDPNCVGEIICGDLIDNDDDGSVDCADDDCCSDDLCVSDPNCVGDMPDMCIDDGVKWKDSNNPLGISTVDGSGSSEICRQTSDDDNWVGYCCPANFVCLIEDSNDPDSCTEGVDCGCQLVDVVDPTCERRCGEITDQPTCEDVQHVLDCGIIPIEHTFVRAELLNNVWDGMGCGYTDDDYQVQCDLTCVWNSDDEECEFNRRTSFSRGGNDYECRHSIGAMEDCIGVTRQIVQKRELWDVTSPNSANHFKVIDDQDIIDANSWCSDTTINFLCSFGTRLSFFSLFNLVVSVGVIFLIYVFWKK
ncbi:MAG: hypothetical protein KKF56_04030, partial [Nanoarchaeota archaeon]|nr:hypothetical protein [Nanoarchaeota archaeon]